MLNNFKILTSFNVLEYEKIIRDFLSNENEDSIDEKIKIIEFSNHKCLIFNKEKLIGFLYLTKKIDNVYFVDIFINKNYRNQGIGSYAFDCLKIVAHLKEFLILKNSKNTSSENDLTENLGLLIHETVENRYYLMQFERISEFFNNEENVYERFVDYCNKEDKKINRKIKSKKI